MSRPIAETKKTARRDPRPSGLDATQSVLSLAKKDPNRVYKLVFKADQQHGIDYYEFQGFEIEIGRDGGPKWAMGQTAQAQPMERLGHVLMSCTKKRHEEIVREGAFGDNSGLGSAEELEAMIFSRSGRAPGTDGGPGRIEDDGGNSVMDWELPPATRVTVEQ